VVEARTGVILWFCCEKKTQEKSKTKGEREKNKKIICPCTVIVYMQGYCNNFVYLYIDVGVFFG